MWIRRCGKDGTALSVLSFELDHLTDGSINSSMAVARVARYTVEVADYFRSVEEGICVTGL